MKARILAFIVSLFVCGSAGAYVNNGGNSNAASSNESGVVSQVSGSSASSESALLEAADTSSTCPVTQSSTPAESSSAVQNVSAAQAADQSASAPAQVNSSTSSAKNSTACSQNPVCSSNSTCVSNGADCSQNQCAPNGGTICTQGNSCTQNAGNCYGSLSDTLNSIMNNLKNSCGQYTQYTQGSTSSATSSKAASSSAAASSKAASSSAAASSSSQQTVSQNASANSSSSGYTAWQNEVLNLVNQERTSRGLSALTMDSALVNTATLKSQDMVKNNYFSHTSPTYGSPFDMMKQFGISYRTAGENIAMGQTSPQQVMQAWMNSEGHRANILNSSFTKLGVGIAQNASGQYYWTQQFIG